MKYMGSKRRIAKQISAYINEVAKEFGIEDYYEPFCGGASVAEEVNIKNRYCSDINRYVIALLGYVADGSFRKETPRVITEDEWKDMREHLNDEPEHTKYPDWLTCYAGFLCSFRGRWFEGYFREYIDKASGQSRTNISSWYPLLEEESKLKGIHFETGSYERLDPDKIKGAVIYCDSPYNNTYGYTNRVVGDGMDFNKYYEWLKKMAVNNIVFISEYNMPYDFFVVDSWVLTGGIGSGRTDDGVYLPTERLFMVKGGYGTDRIKSWKEDEVEDF